MPEDFLNEEIRTNFIVSQTRKKIWAIELDLTAELLRVCEKHKIKLFAAYGTLLGAVRHEGFIPWDDDMDFFMLRDDYDRLMKVASEEFKEPYFMQTALSDRLFFNGYARLRKSNTTGAVSFTDSPNFNNGIFVDIFVLDGIPLSFRNIRKQKSITLFLSHLLSCYYADIENAIPLKKRLFLLYIRPIVKTLLAYDKIFRIYEQNLKKFNSVSKEVACLCVPSFYSKPLPRNCFDDVEYRNFEFLQIPVPSRSNELLTILYGDYMKFPPHEERGTWHENVITFDPDIPYKEYYQKRFLEKQHGSNQRG